MFEWDLEKNEINFKKHGLRFEDVTPVFYDENAITKEDSDHGEQRWKTLGMGRYLVVVVVVYTYNRKIRIISARKAEKHERKKYEKKR